ncbi:MAG TPA: hypothetical protein VLE50_02055 [Cellvibrio sp.]|nr:hypothetical protein [Cellvibrio sp.]
MDRDELLLEATLLDVARLEVDWLDKLDEVDERAAELDGFSEFEFPPPQAESIKVKPKLYMQVMRCFKGIISAPSYVYYGLCVTFTDLM